MTTKSCRTCPSFVPADEAGTVLGKATQADVCVRFGRILSRPGNTPAQDEGIAVTVAAKCADHGAPRPTGRPKIAAQVGIGDPIAIDRTAKRGPVPAIEKPNNCTGCVNFVPAPVVRKELGWALPMCALKGRLLFPKDLGDEAAECGVGYSGMCRDTADGVILLPEFDNNSALSQASGAATVAASAPKIDPRDYVTDKPVSDEEAAACIKAWRRLDNPEGGDPVYLPIFDSKKLYPLMDDVRDTYGQHRPDLYVDHQGLVFDLAVEMFELDETPLLVGEAGTGKTEILCHMAYLMDLPFIRISVDKGTEAWHLKGESKLVTDEHGNPSTVFVAGRFTEWYQQPCVICVDEPNLKNDIYEFLRPATDSAKQLVVDDAQGLKVERDPYSFLGLTQNPPSPLYPNVEPMAWADSSRVTPIRVHMPTDAVERQIISARCAEDDYEISVATLDKIMQVATDLRALARDGALPMFWGIRDQIKVARKTKRYSLEKAFRRAVVDGMEDEVAEIIMGVVRSVA